METTWVEVIRVSPALAGGGKIEDGIDERLGKVGSFALNLRETHESCPETLSPPVTSEILMEVV